METNAAEPTSFKTSWTRLPSYFKKLYGNELLYSDSRETLAHDVQEYLEHALEPDYKKRKLAQDLLELTVKLLDKYDNLRSKMK